MKLMMRMDLKTGAIIAAVVLTIPVLWLVPPIAQDPGYHIFADQRTRFGIPHFWNVISNAPFVILGIMGMSNIALNRTPGYLHELKPVYFTFYTGVFLTGCASAYYHLNPVNQTIVWDRLALTVLFMAVFSSIWGEHISISTARKMVWPLMVVGMASVIYWYVTETRGRGDLRFYALVQFLPMILLPVIMLFSQSKLTGVAYLWGLILAYALAKAAEVLDGLIYRLSDGFSGHEIKHWVAAAGIFIYYLAGFKRKRIR